MRARPVLGLGALLLAACQSSSMRTRSELVPGADLSRYATYAWASVPLAERARPRGGASQDIWQSLPSEQAREEAFLDAHIRADIDRELAQRGYVRTAGPAAMLVDYRVTTAEKRLDDAIGDYGRYLAEGGRDTWGGALIEGYEEATFGVLLVDAATRRPLWYGSATAVVNPSLRAARIPEAIRRIFAGIPARVETQ